MQHKNLRTFLLVLLTFFLILLALALFASPTQAVCLKRIRPKRQLYSREDVIALVQTAAGEYHRTETPNAYQGGATWTWTLPNPYEI